MGIKMHFYFDFLDSATTIVQNCLMWLEINYCQLKDMATRKRLLLITILGVINPEGEFLEQMCLAKFLTNFHNWMYLLGKCEIFVLNPQTLVCFQ